jgi:hypothetical protein
MIEEFCLLVYNAGQCVKSKSYELIIVGIFFMIYQLEMEFSVEGTVRLVTSRACNGI